MPYSSIHLGVWIAGAFCAELPYRPVISMLLVQELYQILQWVSVRKFWICRSWTRCCDDIVRNVAKIKSGFRMASSWAGNDLAKE